MSAPKIIAASEARFGTSTPKALDPKILLYAAAGVNVTG